MWLEMAVAKSNDELKRERKREKTRALERTTNRFMINLAWGIVGIVLLRIVERGYSSADTILQMPVIMKVLAVIFALGAIALFVCGKKGFIKNTTRCYDYAVFTLVAALASLWIGFYEKMIVVARNVFNITASDSRWFISWGLIAAVVVYLVAMLVWTIIRVAMIEKGKK